ncbi:hypothetical protein CEXT_216521, partial [Caerostris extrusa]
EILRVPSTDHQYTPFTYNIRRNLPLPFLRPSRGSGTMRERTFPGENPPTPFLAK